MLPGCYRARAGTMKAQKTKKSGRGGSGLFHDDPDDVIHSATYGMAVSRQGNDKGARVRDTKDVTVIDDGQKVRATAVKDPVDRIYESGNISEQAYAALRLFQKEFDRCGYAHYAKMNMNGGGGGRTGGIEEVFAKAQTSRDYVHNIFRLLGGVDSQMARVMFWSVGLGCSFDRIVSE